MAELTPASPQFHKEFREKIMPLAEESFDFWIAALERGMPKPSYEPQRGSFRMGYLFACAKMFNEQSEMLK